MARYFVTGATGFVGGVLARQLLAAGHQVVTLARDPSRAGTLAAAGAQVHRGDITERDTLTAPMRGVDGVFHVAAWYRLGARDAGAAERINVEGTRNVLETMRDLGVRKGVYTSTLAVHGDTRGRIVDETYRFDGPFASAYDRTKWRAHHEVAGPLMKAGLPLVIVQPGVVYGPGDTSSLRRMLHQFLKRRLPLVPAGAAYCWAHVEDVARGHVLAMERGRAESYHLAGPPESMENILRRCSEWSGVPMPPVAPPWLLRTLSVLLAPFAAMLDETMHPETLRVMAGATYQGTATKAERELGWRARPIEDGLRETLLNEMRELGMKPPA